jgi:hypothetical protein
LRGGHTGGRFGLSTRRVQSGGRASLARRRRGFDSLQLGDALDQRRLVSRRVDRSEIIEHVFEYIPMR